MVEAMQPIKEASVELETSHEPSLHVAGFNLLDLLYSSLIFGDWKSTTAPVGATFGRAFRLKLAHYLDDYELLLMYATAAFLDPR